MNKLWIVFSVMMLVGCNSPLSAKKEFTKSLMDTPSFPEETGQFTEKKTVRITQLDLTDENVTYLTSEVNAFSVDAVIKDIEKFNDLNDEPIYLILDTPGGSVLDGGRLISAMQASKNPIYAIDTGIAASMGFMILEHATKRFGVARAILMAHPASLGIMFQGELDKAVSRLSFLKRFVDKMDRYIANRVGVTYEEFKAKSSREFWLDSSDALEQRYLDKIVSVKFPKNAPEQKVENKIKQAIRME